VLRVGTIRYALRYVYRLLPGYRIATGPHPHKQPTYCTPWVPPRAVRADAGSTARIAVFRSPGEIPPGSEGCACGVLRVVRCTVEVGVGCVTLVAASSACTSDGPADVCQCSLHNDQCSPWHSPRLQRTYADHASGNNHLCLVECSTRPVEFGHWTSSEQRLARE